MVLCVIGDRGLKIGFEDERLSVDVASLSLQIAQEYSGLSDER